MNSWIHNFHLEPCACDQKSDSWKKEKTKPEKSIGEVSAAVAQLLYSSLFMHCNTAAVISCTSSLFFTIFFSPTLLFLFTTSPSVSLPRSLLLLSVSIQVAFRAAYSCPVTSHHASPLTRTLISFSSSSHIFISPFCVLTTATGLRSSSS